MNGLTTYAVESKPHGRSTLTFTLTDAGREWLREQAEDPNFNIHADVTFLELVEGPRCNGLSEVPPEKIGALTGSLIFAEANEDEDGNWPNDVPYFWFPDYQIISPAIQLRDKGFVVFTTA